MLPQFPIGRKVSPPPKRAPAGGTSRARRGRRMSLAAGLAKLTLSPKASLVKFNGLRAVTKLLSPNAGRRDSVRGHSVLETRL